MTVRKLTSVAARSAALLFTAYWLVATTTIHDATPDAPRCFADLGDHLSLQVLVGPSQGDAGMVCPGMDGVATGSTLVFDLQRQVAQTGCIDYSTTAVHGVSGVTFDPGFAGSIAASGTYYLPQDSACAGLWAVKLSPATPPAAGQTMSPLDASASMPWVLEHTIDFLWPGCGHTLGEHQITCADRFTVESVVAGP